MRLLFGENLSPHLAAAFQIVTKDAGYQEHAVIRGYPPKVIWVRLGNVTTAQIEQRLREQAEAIRRLEEDKDAAVLIVSPRG